MARGAIVEWDQSPLSLMLRHPLRHATFATCSGVVQRQNARLLTGRALVRLQPPDPSHPNVNQRMPSDRSGYSSDAFGSTYAHFQWSKAQITAESNPDPEVQGRAEARIARWTQVMEHAMRGTADYGSLRRSRTCPLGRR